MKKITPKLLLLAMFLIATLFFSNDFGLIDIEKTAIVTAVAIDLAEDGEYQVTCQIAVPEASNALSENQKAQITAKGNTVGNAIKSLGSVSGWFPQTIFCNLIIVGGDLSSSNVLTVLDYFSKTMRVQDSAQVVLAQDKAKDLLNATTPLDNVSSFAIQKILLKNPGFDQDVAPVDIKTFCVGYYSSSASSYMPIVKVLNAQDNSVAQGSSSSGQDSQSGGSGSGSSSGGSSSEKGSKTEGQKVFDATTTALFVGGKKVGELGKSLTHTFNMLTKKINGSAFAVDDVDGKNYLLTVLNDTNKLTVKATENALNVCASVKLYCKISDQNTVLQDSTFEKNNPLPDKVKKRTEQMISDNIRELFETAKQTGCDFLGIKEKLYRFNYKQYSRYKDNYLSMVELKPQVTIIGQH